jgi:polar amino acid transport system substrate-binding protein
MKSAILPVIALIIGLAVGYLLGMYTTPQQAPPATTTTTTSTQTSQASVQCPVSVDVIKKRGRLIVGTDATWPPWEWVMGDKIVGWDIDIAREIAKALGVQLEIRDMRFAGLLEAVRKGDVDLAISAITWTSEREEALEFSCLTTSSP